MSSHIKLAPSVLSADFARLGEQVAEATSGGADYIHIDVMDGHFVPNITVGALVVAAVRSWTDLDLDVHLMIENPECYIPEFVSSGATLVTVHVEACPHIHRTVQSIKQLGARAGVAVNPATPLSSLEEIIRHVDLVLVMSVNPGFGGQVFIPETLDKVARLRSMLDERQLTAELEVDGGITLDNAAGVVRAGAGVLAIGNSLFKSQSGIIRTLQAFRETVS